MAKYVVAWAFYLLGLALVAQEKVQGDFQLAIIPPVSWYYCMKYVVIQWF